jgi:hypothetical protein
VDESTRQETIDWVHRNAPENVTTDQLREIANDSNLAIDAKQLIMDLPDREWDKTELADEINERSRGGNVPTGGFFPTSGSPV